MDVTSNLGGYFDQFNAPLSVSVIAKITKWPNLQSMSHDAMLSDLSTNFHGTKDAKIQFNLHTLANPTQLAAPYAAIKALLLLNNETKKLLSDVGSLGPVGPAISNLGNLGATFTMSSSMLTGGSKSVAKLLG